MLFALSFPGQQHCKKSVQIRSFFWSVFSRIRTSISPYSVRMRENTELPIVKSEGTYKNSETWNLRPIPRTQRLKLDLMTAKYSSSCHIQTTILGMVLCVEHKAGIIFQEETLFGQRIVLKILILKVATAKTCFL